MSDSMAMNIWEERFEEFLHGQGFTDSSHGLDHIRRVVANAKRIGRIENARDEVLLPAAWLHDCVAVEKNSPDRSRASTMAAEQAHKYLTEAGYPLDLLDEISHAIQAHSFSAGIAPLTVEAKVLQDADRLDALGAVGLARCMMVGERMSLPLYHDSDPFAREREPDDRRYVIDHFFVKLLKLPATMQTDAGRIEAERRADFLREYLQQLESEISLHNESLP